jgi:hypothetical protein
VIFVDETLIQIDGGQDYYWLWIAYEPNMDLCLMMHTYQEKEPSSYMLSVLQGITEEIWQKDHITDDARWYIMMVLANG